MALGSLEGKAPHYTLDELYSEPGRILEYLYVPETDEVQRTVSASTDLRFLPLLGQDVDASQLDDALMQINQECEAVIQTLQNTENDLRGQISAALGEDTKDEDLGESVHRLFDKLHGFSQQQQQQKATSKEDKVHENLKLDLLTIARNCTDLLAQAEHIEADAIASADDISIQMDCLERLSLLTDNIPASNGPESIELLNRAKSELIRRRDAFYEKLRQITAEGLNDVLREMQWPPPECENPNIELSSLATGFSLASNPKLQAAWADVCELQLVASSLSIVGAPSCIRMLPLLSPCEQTSKTMVQPGSDEYVPLHAVSLLMEPVLLRFRYHFDGDRSTNRLDKPEWFLRHMLALLQMNSRLFSPAKDAWSKGGDVCELTKLRRSPQDRHSFCQRHCIVESAAELLHTIVYPLRVKILASMPLLASEPALLAHNISQCLSFDSDLRETYEPATITANKRGVVRIADEILGNDKWFQAWLDGERDFAQQRFETILASSSAWKLVQADTLAEENDMDLNGIGQGTSSAVSVEAGSLITTRCACSLIGILNGVTERYQPLRSLGQQCAFIVRVQRPLLSDFGLKLVRHLDAFENMSSAFSRSIPGEIGLIGVSSSNEEVRGTNGINLLAKALLSAEYIRQQLEDWSESSFFLNMDEELVTLDKSSPLYRLILPTRPTDDVDSAGVISILKRGLQRGAHAAANLRPLALSGASEANLDGVSLQDRHVQSVWDGTRTYFSEIVERSLRSLQKMIVAETLEMAQPYINREQTPDIVEDVDSEEQGGLQQIPSPQLLPALAKFSSMLSHCIELFPARFSLTLYRQIADTLSRALVEKILKTSKSHSSDYLKGTRNPRQLAPNQRKRFQLDVERGWLHVVDELSEHPIILARKACNEPTGLGRNPRSAWRNLIDASQ
ncbi:hypothetical protein MYAM1_000321 [Malassezia yamatoensis]|uniref:Uncharacterized protein n=1 Tax=Malassezia yamatoensis TaxID=253288 RepID=A0AAJ6CFD0_9BASI|nr:hypothetical protein MYAM1_000321 [Malassezia yamatoensis]